MEKERITRIAKVSYNAAFLFGSEQSSFKTLYFGKKPKDWGIFKSNKVEDNAIGKIKKDILENINSNIFDMKDIGWFSLAREWQDKYGKYGVFLGDKLSSRNTYSCDLEFANKNKVIEKYRCDRIYSVVSFCNDEDLYSPNFCKVSIRYCYLKEMDEQGRIICPKLVNILINPCCMTRSDRWIMDMATRVLEDNKESVMEDPCFDRNMGEKTRHDNIVLFDKIFQMNEPESFIVNFVGFEL